MRVLVNGIHLFFDVEGAGLVPHGPTMKEKPVMLLLHGGPGADHSLFKPSFGQLSDLVQLVYLDHPGCGRSEYGSVSSWNLAQWGDDVLGFCEALGIEQPIVFDERLVYRVFWIERRPMPERRLWGWQPRAEDGLCHPGRARRRNVARRIGNRRHFRQAITPQCSGDLNGRR